MRSLDPEAVLAFVLVAELRSFTRAARVLNSTQSAVSLRISRLEKRLDRRLFERTPRVVRLTPAGEAFLEPARAFADASRRAAEAFEEKPGRLVVGISHHMVGSDLPALLRHLRTADRSLIVDLRIGPTRALLDSYDAGELDAVVIIRHDESRRDGESVFNEDFLWMATAEFEPTAGEPLPLILQAEPCKLRAMAVSALANSGIAWREAFLGGGALSVAGAASAGLGVAMLARRAAPRDLVDVGIKLGLPSVRSRPVMLHSNLSNPGARRMLQGVLAGLRGMHTMPPGVKAS